MVVVRLYSLCVQGLSTSVVRSRLRGLEAGRWPAWVFSKRNSRVETRVERLELMADPPGSFRHDVTYSVRVGNSWIDQPSQDTSDVPVREVIVNSRFRAHRLWSWVGQANNIALLQLEKGVTYSRYIWPICLPGLDYEVTDQSICSVTGWGRPRANGESEPPRPGWVVWEGPGRRLGSAMDRCF